MLTRQSAFYSGWHPVIKSPAVKVPAGVVQPRPWQEECFNEFILSSLVHGIMNCPTGSGKSKAIAYLISYVLSYTDKKVIIAVPQKVIGGGFSEIQKFQMPNGTIVDYRIEERNNLCQKYLSEQSKTQGLIRFLEDDSSILYSDRVVLCTHQTLARVFELAKKKNKLEIFDDTALWIDEAHHLLNSGNDISNKIGQVSKHYLEHEDRGSSLHLATATLFRGDRASITPQKYDDKFVRYSLPYDRHFEENCEGLAFSYDFLLSDKGWFEAVDSIFKDKIGKTIVFIPHPSHKASSGHGKYKEVKQVIQAVAGCSICKVREDENGVIYVNRGKEEIAVIDVVDEEGREKKLDYLREHPDAIDVVIGINVPKEGFDWPCANREIIIGIKNSLNELIQMIGRVFRYHPEKSGGKNLVEIIQVIPWVDQKNLDKDTLRDQLNDFMKAVYATLVLESVMNPVDIEVPTKKEVKSGNKRKIDVVLEYIKTTVGDTEYINLWESIIDVLVDFRNANPLVGKDEFDEKYGEIIKQELKKTKIDSYHDEISKLILRSLKRRTLNVVRKLKGALSGIDVSLIDVDIVNEYDPLNFILGYTNQSCGVLNLRDFKRKKSTWDDAWFEKYEAVLDFQKQNDRLPSSKRAEESVLANWCTIQRMAKRGVGSGFLTEGRICLLEKIPGWFWALDFDDVWLGNYEKVFEFQQRHNRLPNHRNPGEEKLGFWCTNQRLAKKRGGERALDEEKIHLLEKIPGWFWGYDDIWYITYEKVLEFERENKRLPKETSKNPSELKLARWCNAQRNAKKGQGTRVINDERIGLLEKIPGWRWGSDLNESWLNNYQKVLEFQITNNRLPNRHSKILEEKRLGEWCSQQRRCKKRDKLSEDRIGLLEKIPNWKWHR